MPGPLVIQTEELEPEAQAWLRRHATLEICPHDDPRLPTLLADAQGLVVRTYTQVGPRLLDSAPALRVVGRAGVALENIDVPACRARGVEVVHTPEANTQAVVEFTLAMLLDARRPRVFLDEPLVGDAWHRARRDLQADDHVADLPVGILGFGRIGRRVGRALAALGCSVLYHDLADVPESDRYGCAPATLDDLVDHARVLSIHVDFRESNRHMIDAGFLARLREDAILINTARGLVVEPFALAAWLRAHPGAQALLDVHDPHEPIGPDYPLLGVPNAHLAPHIAAATKPARLNMSWVVRDVVAVLEGREPAHRAPEY